MLTDGALRMLILLHFHQIGISPLQLAYIFLIYELMGVLTNLSAGFLGKRLGLKTILYIGLILQIIALTVLSLIPDQWPLISMMVYATVVQGLSGIAKDLTKTSAKASVKILAPQNESDTLFKWVAKLTGSKNTIKGFGFFLGCGLLASVGFSIGSVMLAILLLTTFLIALVFAPPELPKGSTSTKIRHVISNDKKINYLSLARLFLFGARDVWFVVGIPLFFFEILSDGSTEENRYAFFVIGSFMAIWIIFYGLIQAWVPSFFRGIKMEFLIKRTVFWISMLALCTISLTTVLFLFNSLSNLITISLVVLGLFIFGAIFAINSSLHSFLILYFTTSK